MNPNTFQLARVIHEGRIEEALQRQRHRPIQAIRLGLPVAQFTQVRKSLGNLLIVLGTRLKAQQQSEFA